MAEISLTRAEQETIIILTADQPDADIYTCDPVMIRRMAKLREKRPDVFQITESDALSVTYRCPKKCVKVNAPRVVSDEQREAARERFAQARAQKDDDSDELTLDFEDGYNPDDVEQEAATIERRWRKQWTTIAEQIDVLMRGSDGNRVVILCKDGHAQLIEFDRALVAARMEIETLKIPSETVSNAMDEIPVADVIERIWKHGGVDMAVSRAATKARV